MLEPISDTQEVLRGARASAREKYYKTSTKKYVVLVFAIVLFLALAVIGLDMGGSRGYVMAFCGAAGLAMVSLVLFLHGG